MTRVQPPLCPVQIPSGASSETQTLTRSKPHPYGIACCMLDIRLNTPTLGTGARPFHKRPWEGGSTCRPGLVLRQHSRIALSLLQHQSTGLHLKRLLKRGSEDCRTVSVTYDMKSGSGYCRTFLCSVTQAAQGS